jgi:hypothetical protein
MRRRAIVRAVCWYIGGALATLGLGVFVHWYGFREAIETRWLPAPHTCLYVWIEKGGLNLGVIRGFARGGEAEFMYQDNWWFESVCAESAFDSPSTVFTRHQFALWRIVAYDHARYPTGAGVPLAKRTLSFGIGWLTGLLMLPLLVWAAILGYRWRRMGRSPLPRCAQCGYCVFANESGRCPECGAEVVRKQGRRGPSRKRIAKLRAAARRRGAERTRQREATLRDG